MSSEYKDRYGIPGPEVTNLVRRFYKRLYDSDWEKADDFIKWCSENGYKSDLRLCKKDTSKPHGPENSYFKASDSIKRAIKEENRRRKEERKSLVSPFCIGCQKGCSNHTVGCKEYRAWFVKNWNQNIRVEKPVEVKTEPEGPMVFRYEHPDLVREGIVFEGSARM
jgi:hypothetical protein